MATVEVNYYNIPQGRPVEIIGLGKFVNGETSEIPSDVWRRFQTVNPGYPSDFAFKFTSEEKRYTPHDPGPSQEEVEKIQSSAKENLVNQAEEVGVEDADQYDTAELTNLINEKEESTNV